MAECVTSVTELRVNEIRKKLNDVLAELGSLEAAAKAEQASA